MDIALFGGSFNPPHLGHYQVIRFLDSLKKFNEVWIIPSFHHPYNKELAPFEDRLALCELIIKGTKARINSIERKMDQSPTYTIDVVRVLKKEHPTHRFCWVVGSDCQKDLPNWHRYDKLKNEVNFFFLPRAGNEDSPFMDVSSSEVRELIQKGEDYSQYVLPEVGEYIEKNGLYRL